jgi:hypothetical protein
VAARENLLTLEVTDKGIKAGVTGEHVEVALAVPLGFAAHETGEHKVQRILSLLSPTNQHNGGGELWKLGTAPFPFQDLELKNGNFIVPAAAAR